MSRQVPGNVRCRPSSGLALAPLALAILALALVLLVLVLRGLVGLLRLGLRILVFALRGLVGLLCLLLRLRTSPSHLDELFLRFDLDVDVGAGPVLVHQSPPSIGPFRHNERNLLEPNVCSVFSHDGEDEDYVC